MVSFGVLFIGYNIFPLILDKDKIADEVRKVLVKEVYELTKSLLIRTFGFGSSDSTWPAVKLVRDPPHHKYIANREKELKELKELFDGFPSHDNVVNVVYLFGVPGSGKTEIARQYGNFAYEKHGVSTVITLNAEGSHEFRKTLFNVLQEIKTPKLTIEHVDLMQRWKLSDLVNELRQLLQKRTGWLLIVDNIRDPNITQKELYKELPRPGTDKWGTGMMLVTTQVPLHHRNSAHVKIKDTNDGLILEDATTFLCGLVTRNESARGCDKKVATDIVIELERLPLSIFAAGIYIESSMSMKSDGSYSIASYLAELQSLGILHAQDLKPSQSEYRLSMLAALQLTINQTINVNSEQLPADVFLDFMALIGYAARLDEATIPSVDVEDYMKMRGHDPKLFLTLRNFPLVNFLEDKKRFWVHQVVRYAFRAALERRGTDLLLYSFGNISHYFVRAHSKIKKRVINPSQHFVKSARMFGKFVESLPNPYCHQNLCIIPLEEDLEDLIDLFSASYYTLSSPRDSSSSPSHAFCAVLDTFLKRLRNIRIDNPNRVSLPKMLLGYQKLHSCFKGQFEKQNKVATRAIDIIKEVTPEHSEIHTAVVSTFILKESSKEYNTEHKKWLKNSVFHYFLCSKTPADMYFRVRDIRRVVDYFQKLCLSLSEFYKLAHKLYPHAFTEDMEIVLISISKMASTEVRIECVATMSRCFTLYRDGKVIHDKGLPNEHHIGLGRSYMQLGQYGTKQSYVRKHLYGACSSKEVCIVRDFGLILIFYIDYDIRIGLKNTEIVFDKYFQVFNYFIPMLQKFKTILQKLIFRHGERENIRCQSLARYTLATEINKRKKIRLTLPQNLSVTKIKSTFRDNISLFIDHLLCIAINDELLVYNTTNILPVDKPVYDVVPQGNINTIDSIRRYVYIDAMAFSLRELLCYQRPKEATEILLEVFDAIMYAFWPTTESIPDLEL